MQESQRKVKVGVVGCGVVATAYYLPHMLKMPEVEIVAVCDIFEDRIKACQRLYGARETYTDYYDMVAKADIEAVLILTGPGTHAPFTIAAAEAGKHILLQKPMATNMEDAIAIKKAVRDNNVIAVVEPSERSLLDFRFTEARNLIRQGVLGDPYWFALIPKGATEKNHPMAGGNPYGVGAFFSKDSGGMLFDYPYFPTAICTLLGDCKSVQGLAKVSVPERYVVPDDEYNKFLKECDDPHEANYWPVVLDKEKTQKVKMGAPDNIYSLYEMKSGWIGACHVGRLFQPAHPMSTYGNLEIYGSEGNLLLHTDSLVSINSTRTDLLPETDENGWYNIPDMEGVRRIRGPVPPDGGFNYYHVSTDHFIDCILHNKQPLIDVDWGLHITEMMCGAIISAETGQRYEMTTSTGVEF
ncbi:Gfo/Idh/MocA family protein [Pelagicoccus mobilis]|uniref:Gfo/Idh/MocA family oxidoreductase n=1 Tax=Pelagicoccus mobilis TaxID=415221 RepID=A0A934VPG7_9BACT|nr:Gfo/Idh/MocA family oxidoreductase [Pelagicoccus mobilis]MBK1875513.1 Gfo/Idh/MocA family oxidoreductase [Pelagicoccus mobilis]